MKSASEYRDDRKNGVTTVFYDGACPTCVRSMNVYVRLAGPRGSEIRWVDITGRDAYLRQLGIDPHKALRELHVQGEGQGIHSEIDAYIVLMHKVPLTRPLAWLLGQPRMRPLLARWYHRTVDRRLRQSGRL